MEEQRDGGRPTDDGGSKDAAPDLISNLPDSVISSILSLLTFKEAAATSVLSWRWKYLWTSYPRLVFDRETFPGMKRDAFVKLVDYIVNLYLYHSKGVTLQEFCVHFSPNISSMYRIANWLDFALPRAARVDVDFDLKSYAVPIEVFLRPSATSGSESTELILPAETVPPPTRQNRFTSLRELFLSCTHVSDQVFEAILSTCASLECFAVTYDRLLRSAKCTVPHLKLKHMTIQSKHLLDLEIIAPNLVSFNYFGPRANLCIQGAQSLVNAVILSQDKQDDFLFGPLSSYTSQLECLTLDTGSVLGRMTHNKALSLCNLRTISLADVYAKQNLSLLLCHRAALCLLEACPLLQRFELHLGVFSYNYYGEGELSVEEHEDSRHKNLKEFMLTGLCGYECEIYFLAMIARRAIALESVEVSLKKFNYMVDRRGSFNRGVMLDSDVWGTKEDVEKLCSMLPSNVCVKYLDD